MAIDMSARRSRRALLAAAAGAAAATVVSAIEQPAAVRAGSDGDVVLGESNYSQRPTSIRNSGYGSAFAAESSDQYPTIMGTNRAPAGHAVMAESRSGCGVWATSESGPGVRGQSVESAGVLGTTETEGRIPVVITAGVQGIARSGQGVHGEAEAGIGVRGEAWFGTGVSAATTHGTALMVEGRATFSRSGKATIKSGRSYVDVNVTALGGLAGTPLCFANLQRYRSGVIVAAVRPSYPSASQMRIYLNRAVTSSITVAWVILG